MNTNPDVETSNTSDSSPALTRVLEQSDQAKHLVEESAKELDSVKASIGISIFPQNGTTAGMLTKSTDRAMYRAKGTKSGYALAE